MAHARQTGLGLGLVRHIPYGEPEQAGARAASQHFDVPLPWD